MAQTTKRRVDALLYGTGDRRRFTLDSPIQSDVWALFFDDPHLRADLLLQPWLDKPAFEVAGSLLIGDGLDQVSARLSYNRTVVVAKLTLSELLRVILPLTGWYNAISGQAGLLGVDGFYLPSAEEVWQDLSLSEPDRSARVQTYPFGGLLGLIRIAGIIFAKSEPSSSNPSSAKQISQALSNMLSGDGRKVSEARKRLAKFILQGWESSGLRLPHAAKKAIYAVSRNRPVSLAMRQSVRTVKGDAAALLFNIDCSKITWAIVDSGIDASHPAFAILKHSDGTQVSNGSASSSRVVETWDFSGLRHLLTAGDFAALSPSFRSRANVYLGKRGSEDASRAFAELANRISRSQQIDWEQLKPFLRIDHTAYVTPTDPHGTHVAGILAADWTPPNDKPLQGMCPTIQLMDVRICRDDGSSDEFTIMSALQFLRHLNSNSDRMVVHGINMSLSLEHDAAVYACGQTPVCEEAARAVASGIVVVAAAGNHGYRRFLTEGYQAFDQYCPVSITDPGNAEDVITVGSTHRLEPHNFGISYFSSRGPTGDGRLKPDLVAPGEKILSTFPGSESQLLDGTSMAAPHVSGAAAMLMARHVELVGHPRRIKEILCNTATDLGREPYFQGKGLVDVLRAIQSV